MIGVEFVRDRDTGAVPAGRSARRNASAAAREDGLLLYSLDGTVDGIGDDLVVLGPPFGPTDEEAGHPAGRADGRAVSSIA